MIKMVYAWRDRAALGSKQCEENYRRNHVALARKAFDGAPGFQALVYNRVREALVSDYNQREGRPVSPDIDAFVELYFDDEPSLEAAFRRPELEAMFQDHVNFMETEIEANVRVYRVDEAVLVGALHREANSES